jgi:tRNA-2-methylthio-N6-dimethylallyladenosine synthase
MGKRIIMITKTIPKVYIRTYGCQMNKHDTEKLLGVLTQHGFQEAQSYRDASVIIFNTCSVRNRAEGRAYGEINKISALKRSNPKLIIGVVGCMAKKEGERIFERASQVNFVVGPDGLMKIPQIIKALQNGREQIIDTEYHSGALQLGSQAKRTEKARAWVSIMKGCNNFCSYCVVPYLRGPEISRPSSEIIEEVKELVAQGIREVTLLGQNVNSYGRGLSEKIDFPELLEKLDKISGLKRIRFVTSHPKDITLKLIQALKGLRSVCEHLHLPLQSGSNKILKAMARGHTIEYYREIIHQLREKVPEASLTTDIIVGFPGEEEVDFETTCAVLEEIKFDSAFIFKYSPRAGTAAAKLKDSVPEKEKLRRLTELNLIQRRITTEINRCFIGKELELLFEERSKKSPDFLTGRARNNKIVIVKAPSKLLGTFQIAQITQAPGFILKGELKKEAK